MKTNKNAGNPQFLARCCPHHDTGEGGPEGLSRREFMESVSAAMGGLALTGISWKSLSAETIPLSSDLMREPLRVQPILVYSTPQRQHQRSWRAWGGIQTETDAEQEVGRITSELSNLKKRADFPVECQPVSRIKRKEDLAGVSGFETADVLLIYAAGGWMDTFAEMQKLGKDMIFFCRHKSGPVYLWYEIISPRFLRQHTDNLAVKGADEGDVVIDSQDDLLWRMRALCGLKNTLGTKILAIGGPGAWAQPQGIVPRLVKDIWRFDIRTIAYEELGHLIQEARQDRSAVARARERAEEYLKAPGVTLETKRAYVHNAFLLEHVFSSLMERENCRAITINGCMGTIMPMAETTACLTLSLLNDANRLAFCESDFVVIPSGVLLSNISGHPVFLNDPTYPHDGLITLAHCTAPRKMDGESLDPARIMTHFESDYGAAPKVEMRKGQTVTNIIPDFKAERWVGLLAEIVDAPFMDICRSQIDIRFTCDSRTLAERMPGFHWMTSYGNYIQEMGYALKHVGITWELL